MARAGFCGVLISCSFTFHTCLRRIRRFRVNDNLRLAEQVPDCQSNSPEPPEPEERKKGKKEEEKKNEVGGLVSQVYLMFILSALLNCTFLAALKGGARGVCASVEKRKEKKCQD